MNKKEIITLKNVSYSYSKGAPDILKNINLSVYEGEFLGIIGPTGTGKTTLLNILSGVIPHYYDKGVISGEVLIDGIPTQELSIGKITANIGLVMQDPEAQLFNLLVSDELVWGLENRGYTKEDMKKKLANCVKLLNLQKLVDRVTYDLSGGEKQRTALGAIYIIGSKIFILDNPTSQLDPLGAETVIETVKQLVETDGHTIIMVEDKVGELVKNADRLVLLDDGEIKLIEDPRGFCAKKDILEASGLRTFELSELAYLLQQEGINVKSNPITLEEGIDVFKDLLAI